MALVTKEFIRWQKDVKKSLIDKDLTHNMLSMKVGLTRPHVSGVISGRILSRATIQKLTDYLEVEPIEGLE